MSIDGVGLLIEKATNGQIRWDMEEVDIFITAEEDYRTSLKMWYMVACHQKKNNEPREVKKRYGLKKTAAYQGYNYFAM
ncbi:hypothetical protein SUVZ_10G2320 [Saccharomyces uvarum]|uniref:Uncharacterized protein n=1 Tax=Saccharomyces uvarum TaxID=230603 RepID=A0ABN8WF42_SACUV|nr:hypothetical protein SUVZ_10G2320 [Saccharomyces uvarum]